MWCCRVRFPQRSSLCTETSSTRLYTTTCDDLKLMSQNRMPWAAWRLQTSEGPCGIWCRAVSSRSFMSCKDLDYVPVSPERWSWTESISPSRCSPAPWLGQSSSRTRRTSSGRGPASVRCHRSAGLSPCGNKEEGSERSSWGGAGEEEDEMEAHHSSMRFCSAGSRNCWWKQ